MAGITFSLGNVVLVLRESESLEPVILDSSSKIRVGSISLSLHNLNLF